MCTYYKARRKEAAEYVVLKVRRKEGEEERV
jgi:hypothetical protein